MVLEDIDKSAPDAYSNGSDYTDDTSARPFVRYTGPGPYPFDSRNFPRPVPILGPLLGFSESNVRYRIGALLTFAEKQIQRRLTPDETQALADAFAKGQQINFYCSAAGLAIGAWRWRKTMSTMRFPFYTPKPERINPERFLFVKAPYAQTARHSARLAVWILLGGALGNAAGVLISQPRASRMAASDQRLTAFGHDFREAVERQGQRRSQARQAQGQPLPQSDGAGNFQDLPPHAGAPRWPRRVPAPQTAPPPARSGSNDMSPSSGESWPSTETYADTGYSQKQSRAPTAPTASKSAFPFDDDDASPTGGLFEQETQNLSRSDGSAWDRLRRGEGPPPAGERPRPPQRRELYPRREPRQEGNLGDSFTFAESDEERRRAQEQAQREFDQRIERERQGKDFSDERRW
ncbi:hypothetical protein M011DRAFT_469592 [Sporormia fimetaria CBS 119925]|uniref:Uncharacterized protein n=1 Tax=Sporormia fimetaria CBS 119925 TaxID=1340428 RepID=A0A6A6V8R0_9PLEO|nr:hypothetical protein M011DRAFT_469592 [Sporormia fimetaria CBS 119925]